MRISDWSSDVCSSDGEQLGDDTVLVGARHVAGDRRGIESRGIDFQSFSGQDDLANKKSDGQCNGRYDLEIAQGLETDSSDLLEITHRSDRKSTRLNSSH